MTDLNLVATPEPDNAESFDWVGLTMDLISLSSAGDTPVREGRRLSDLQVFRANPGAPMLRVFGRMRVGGQLIWNGALKEHVNETGGGGDKGESASEPRRRQFRYTMHLGIGLCAGPVSHIGRIWADGRLVDTNFFSIQFYNGSADQIPDPLIAVEAGSHATPAFRGLAYLVFKHFDLTMFGNRVPQLSIEVFAPVDETTQNLKSVVIFPGATELGYHPDAHIRLLGPGRAVGENLTAHQTVSDWTISLDKLQEAYPQCRQVALVVAWFGDDLRAGHCRLQPKVENHEKDTLPSVWLVNKRLRQDAALVSQINARPAFGGTPSDDSVREAIKDLKQRGFDVLFYPFIMMDVPPDNALPDPYGGGTQSAYPWRGRITCNRAAITEQINRFVNGHSDNDTFCLRAMIEHYAELCAEAGGVDAFLIGSEMRGLSQLRDGSGDYPFAHHLVNLAGRVRRHLPQTKISYAADWSEYGAHTHASGDVGFPLDVFWSDANCDFIGIDGYFPLSDWRDGSGHLDAQAGVRDISDLDYLQSNMHGGEYFDWYYRDAESRARQQRSAITDGQGEPWLYRAKDVRGWWSHAHHPRRANQRLSPTRWRPRSKPVWFTEIGCPAVDKGSNQPNIFPDLVSAEGGVPYYSNGQRDDQIQKAYLKAFAGFYDNPVNNPFSPIYRGPMVSQERIYVWAWDARPFPAFPYRMDVWSDGTNWHTGHWLNGRETSAPVGALLGTMSRLSGVNSETHAVSGVLEGFAMRGVEPVRAAVDQIMHAFGVDAITGGARLRFTGRAEKPVRKINRYDVLWDNDGSIRRRDSDPATAPNRLDLHFLDAENAYGPQCVSAHYRGGEKPVMRVALPMAMSGAIAYQIAERMLHEARRQTQTMQVQLPPAYLDLEPGDIIDLDDALWRITRISLRGHLEVMATRFDAGLYVPRLRPRRLESAPARIGTIALPELRVLDLPVSMPGRGGVMHPAGQPRLAAFAAPWPKSVLVHHDTQSAPQVINVPAIIGETASELTTGPVGRLDRFSHADIRLYGGELSSIGMRPLLNGGNVMAIETPLGWEVLQFGEAELIGERLYRLSRLLRGQSGTAAAMTAALPAGAACVLVTGALPALDVPLASIDGSLNIQFGPSAMARDSYGWRRLTFPVNRVGTRCLQPAHLRRHVEKNGDWRVRWVRCSRIGGDDWVVPNIPLGEANEAYRVVVWQGSQKILQTVTDEPQWVWSQAARHEALQKIMREQSATKPTSPARLKVSQLNSRGDAGYHAQLILPVTG